MAWIDRLKEQLPSLADDPLILSLAVAGGVAAVAMAALFPLVVVASVAAVVATAACVGATILPQGQKGGKPAENRNDPAVSARNYFLCQPTPPECDSSRFQEMVSNQDQPSQGWER